MNRATTAPLRGLLCCAMSLVLCALLLCAMPAVTVQAATATASYTDDATAGQGTLVITFSEAMGFPSGITPSLTVLTLAPTDGASPVIAISWEALRDAGTGVWTGGPGNMVDVGTTFTVNLAQLNPPQSLVPGATYQVTMDNLIFPGGASSPPVSAGTITVPTTYTITSITASTVNFNCAGGNATIQLDGRGLPPSIPLRITGAGIDTTLTATNGTDTSRSVDFTFPQNTTAAAHVYSLQYSRNGGATWESSPSGTVTVQPQSVITGFGVDKGFVDAPGGDVNYTITGTNLWDYIMVGAFRRGSTVLLPDCFGYAMVNPDHTHASGMLSMPTNESAVDNAEYILKISLDEGKTWWSSPMSGVTVRKATLHNDNNTITPTKPATGGQLPLPTIQGEWFSGEDYICISGNRIDYPDITFSIPLDIQFFGGNVFWDEACLNPNQEYTAVNGSTIITLKAAFLRNQTYDVHRLRVWFNDGYADLIVDLRAPEPGDTTTPTNQSAVAASPQTGDATSPAAYVGLAALAVAGAGIGATLRRRLRSR